MVERIRRLNAYLRGWLAYFAKADMASMLRGVAGWLRRRLQACLWKQGKLPRTRLRELRALGHAEWKAQQWAMSRRGYWAMARGPLNSALGTAYWDAQGLLRLSRHYHERRHA